MSFAGLGPPPLQAAIWAIAIISLSLLAFALVLRREKEKVARIICLLLLVAFPILAPLAVFLYYLLLQPLRRIQRGKAANEQSIREE